MNILETFYILFETDAKKAEREQEDLRKEAGKTADEIDRSVKNAKKLPDAINDADRNATRLGTSFKAVTGLIAAAGGLLLVGGLRAALNGTVEEADRLVDASARIRLGAEDFDTWRRAVKASGGELEDAEAALASYDEMLRRIQAGIGKRGVEALAGLGLTAENADGSLKDVRTSLLEVAGAVEGLERAEALRKIRRLGITDEGTIQLLLKGRAAVEALSDAQRANGAITQEQADRIDKYKEASEQLSGVIQGWKFAIVSALAPALEGLNRLLIGGIRWLGANRGFVEGLGVALLITAGVVTAIYTPAMIAAAAATLAATWPIIAAVAAIAALGVAFALAYDDVKAFLTGQPSLIGELVERYGWFRALVNGLGVTFRVVGRIAVAVFEGIRDAGEAVFNALSRYVRGWYSVVAPIVGFLWDLFVLVWSGISAAVIGRIRPWLPLIRFVFGAMAAGVQVVGGIFQAVFSAIGAAWDAVFGRIVRGINIAINGARRLLGMRVGENAGAAANGVGVGQNQLAFAGRAPLTAATSFSLTNGGNRRGGDRTVNTGPVTINTQATDAEGIASGFNSALGAQFRDTSAAFDDGVER